MTETDWNAILNWKLQKGSHEFPGPDGGTCINEAAIVAAGFEYKSVNSAADCPPCFSRVLAAYALQLNDRMPDAIRQGLLMPFVTRLAGSADTPQVEQKRIEFIVIATVSRILPVVLEKRGLAEQARGCRKASTLEAARLAADAAHVAAAAHAAHAAAYATAAYAAAHVAAAAHAAHAAHAADAAAADAAYGVPKREIWTLAAGILDGALRIGNQAEPIDTACVVERMAAIRNLTPA